METWSARGKIVILLVAAGFVVAVRGGDGARRQESALVEARKASAELTDKVRGLLLTELEKGGFEGAVRVCSEIAQKITEEHSRDGGYSARRISLKYRNPKDRPDAYETRMLKRFAAQQGRNRLVDESWEVVREGGREKFRYLKPIVIGKMCLQCHGQPDQIAPAVRTLLREKYPQDRAIGYREGELRGAVSVVIDLPMKEKR
ncbi:MAG: DUF3365 domain-containing protein [Blastocatellia bacterium]|nr:DUF3365 domain-containing protein [Blastocatellia bacterium]